MGSIFRSAFALSILPSPTGPARAGGFARRLASLVARSAPVGGDAPPRLLPHDLERAFERAVAVVASEAGSAAVRAAVISGFRAAAKSDAAPRGTSAADRSAARSRSGTRIGRVAALADAAGEAARAAS